VAWLWVAGAVLVVAVVIYWLVITTEGTYLGTRAVVTMYDWTARRYNRIKNLRPVYETYFIGAPLGDRLAALERPVVLDVATGTGRVLQAVLANGGYAGELVGVDHSWRMLREAADALGPHNGQTMLVQGDAHHLMFEDATFDAVTCLEALEFMQDPRQTVREMVRVLKPGGILLVSNRVDREAWLFPGRYCRRGRMEALLRQEGLIGIDTRLWQTYYDLVWAEKPDGIQSKGVGECDEA